MRAMLLETIGGPLRLVERPAPRPGSGELLIRVLACGVCRTDLHLVDGELADARLPIVPGHQIVGIVENAGTEVRRLRGGERVGVPWLGGACGDCDDCREGRENLCDHARFTGCQIDGGYADFCIADERFCFPMPPAYDALQAAPLLCAGLIGYRAYRMAGQGRRLGLYGFGAAAHLMCQVARHQGREVYAFTRPGDATGQAFARRMGAVWAGASDQRPPEALDAAILFAPDGAIVPHALRAVRKGGTVVCAGIHMSDLPSLPYALLWGERVLRTVANLTRRDGEEFLALAPRVPVRSEVTVYPLEDANRALDDLRHGRLSGSAVLAVDPSLRG